MNNLPKVVTQQRRGRGSNPRLLDRKSDALPLSHRATPLLLYNYLITAVYNRCLAAAANQPLINQDGYHQNGDKKLSQMIKLLKRHATVTFIECLVTESALNV